MLRYAMNDLGIPAGISHNPAVWITSKGVHVRVCDMKNGHLTNTILYLRRRAAKIAPMGYMTGDPDKVASSMIAIYDCMMREATKRGLKIARDYISVTPSSHGCYYEDE